MKPSSYVKLLVVIVAFGLVGPSHAGVLIGELPGKPSVDIRDVRWMVAGDEVTFVIVATGPDGKSSETQCGPFAKSMVRQALRYAADSRPLAVTVINTTPLLDQKVLLHPALIDTSEGRHAIRLDLLVRRYAQSQWDQAVERAYRDHALYQLAWAARYEAALEIHKLRVPFGKKPETDDERKQEGYLQELLAARAEAARKLFSDPVVRQRALAALKELPTVTGRQSLLRVKNEFYDQELVTLVAQTNAPEGIDDLRRRVASTHKNVADGFRKAAKEQASLAQSALTLDTEIQALQLSRDNDLRAKLRAKIENHKLRTTALDTQLQELFDQANSFLGKDLASVPEITVPSGVREHRFDGASEDYFRSGKGAPLPFRFMVQVAFTNAPTFLKDGDPDDYSDSNPYEFTDLEPSINAAVQAGLERDADAAATAQEMATFVILQRLFRAGIAGKLGEKFPTSRLTELAEAVSHAGDSSAVRTLRWSPHPARVEADGDALVDRNLAALKSQTSEDAQKTAAVLAKCKALIAERSALRKETNETLKGLDAPGAETAWNKYSEGIKQWLTRWEQEVKELPNVNESKAPVGIACAELALLTYQLQVRQKLNVVGDEWLVREEANWHEE